MHTLGIWHVMRIRLCMQPQVATLSCKPTCPSSAPSHAKHMLKACPQARATCICIAKSMHDLWLNQRGHMNLHLHCQIYARLAGSVQQMVHATRCLTCVAAAGSLAIREQLLLPAQSPGTCKACRLCTLYNVKHADSALQNLHCRRSGHASCAARLTRQVTS